jgi:hypothetical protein
MQIEYNFLSSSFFIRRLKMIPALTQLAYNPFSNSLPCKVHEVEFQLFNFYVTCELIELTGMNMHFTLSSESCITEILFLKYHNMINVRVD